MSSKQKKVMVNINGKIALKLNYIIDNFFKKKGINKAFSQIVNEFLLEKIEEWEEKNGEIL